MTSGLNARIAGSSRLFHALRNAREPELAGSGSFKMLRWGPSRPRVAPEPGNDGDSWEEAYRRVGSDHAIAASPLP